jgi:hypothetical protein
MSRDANKRLFFKVKAAFLSFEDDRTNVSFSPAYLLKAILPDSSILNK